MLGEHSGVQEAERWYQVNGLKIFKSCNKQIGEKSNMAKRVFPLENQELQSAVSVKCARFLSRSHLQSPFRESTGTTEPGGRRATCGWWTPPKGNGVGNLGAAAGEDLEGKGLKLLLSTGRSLVLVQPVRKQGMAEPQVLMQASKGSLLFKAWAAKCRKHEALFCRGQWQRDGWDHLKGLISPPEWLFLSSGNR